MAKGTGRIKLKSPITGMARHRERRSNISNKENE